MTLDYNGNTTRGGAINLIWSYGEATFVMMVWAAPGIPRAFTNQSFPARILSAFRSWTRLGESAKQNSGGSGGGANDNDRWVQTIGGGNIGGGGKAVGKSRKPTATELDLIETRNSEHVEAGHTPENGIWKMTFLETQEDSASQKSTDPITARQHPWIDNNRWRD